MSQVAPAHPEPVVQPPRRVLTDREKAMLMLEHDYRCAECGSHLALADAEFDHIHARGWGGENTEEISNFRPVCVDCHKVKTRADKGVIGWVKRVRARIEGTRRPRKAIHSRGFEKPKTKRPWPKRRLK